MTAHLEKVTKDLLIREARKIARFADRNLGQLDGMCQDKQLLQDYYLGMVRRQAIVLYDIALLLERTQHQNLTSVLILCRCLLDDFLHVFFLKLNDDEEDNIIKLNADVHRQMFNSIRNIMESNHHHFDGENQFYITEEEFEHTKAVFKGRQENDMYFIDKEAFRFKKFKSLSDIATGITDFELSKLAQRAFYFWKEFSEFVHYSNITYEIEIDVDNAGNHFYKIEEVLLYAYNTIELAFRYFTGEFGLDLIDEENLSERYAISY